MKGVIIDLGDGFVCRDDSNGSQLGKDVFPPQTEMSLVWTTGQQEVSWTEAQ